MHKGYIQVYTGNSKGKTTAALGLALRAAGAGLKIFIAQFIKKRRCSEHKALERFSDLITLRQYGTGLLRGAEPTEQEVNAAKEGVKEIKEIVASSTYDLVILDEINIAVHYHLVSSDDILDLFDVKPSGVEMVLTGRYADQRIIERADLVTEMNEIKHYIKKGVKARVGIEF